MASVQDANLAIVKKAYVALEQGHGWDRFLEDFADDCELYEAPSLPYGGVFSGKEMVKAGGAVVFSTFDDFKFKVLNYVAGDDLVVVHLMLTGRGRTTGKTFSMPLMEKWRLRDGKVVELRLFYFDSARVIECFGA